MHRAHRLAISADIIFADSTSSCDTTGQCVTLLLTPSVAGAVPLGIIITEGKSTYHYTKGLNLLKSAWGDSAFYGQGYPSIVMTDDDDAERLAFKTVWPLVELLLCRFHITQAVWRWLTAGTNNIPSDKRASYYQDFNRVLTSLNRNDANEYFQKIRESNCSQWIEYMESYWQRKDIWCLAYRNEKLHGHHTNNFAEISVRILKDEVLHRYKAYNVVDLVEKICVRMEDYYIKRLSNFAMSRDPKNRLEFQREMKKAAYLQECDITRTDNLFLVPSEADKTNLYIVDPQSGFCSCPSGKYGKFCKHQAGVSRFYKDVICNNLPPTTPQARYEMAVLAFGSKAGDMSVYQALQSSDAQDIEVHGGLALAVEQPTPTSAIDDDECQDEDMNNAEKWVEKSLEVLFEKFLQHGCSEEVI